MSSKNRWKLYFLGIAFVCGLAAGAFLALFRDLPEIVALESFESSVITTIYDRNRKVLWEIGREKRRYIPLDKIPSHLKDAVLVTEDVRFFEHTGIDFKGIFRALAKDILSLSFAQGGSTITQQLSRVLFLTHKKSIVRKLKEAVLAVQIERKYTKPQILELYLNQIYYGSGAYGVAQAAKTFFGRELENLSLWELCVLAGLPRGPSYYNPFRHPDRAAARGKLILGKLYKAGLISDDEYDAALNNPPRFLPSPPKKKKGSHLLQMILARLTEELGENMVYKGGLSVFTTVDGELQEVAEKAVEEGIAAYGARHGLKEEGDVWPEAALFARNVHTGDILALVGGRDFSKSQFNRAIQAKRPPGSSFKTIIFARAIQQGFTPSSIVPDFPVQYPDGAGGFYTPTNYDKHYLGFIPMRVALEKSRNTVSVYLASKVGIGGVIKLARALGINSPISRNLTSALGSSAVTLKEMVDAYAAIANSGIRVGDRLIYDVLDKSGNSIWNRSGSTDTGRALKADVAFVTAYMLRAVVLYGTGRYAASIPCFLAGKTGTTDEYRDALFLGFSSDVALGTWVGFDDNRTLGRGETGARAALPIWRAFMEAHCKKDAPKDPVPPRGVVIKKVDHDTGLLYSPQCGREVESAFIRGTEPRTLCEPGVDLSRFANQR